MGVLVTSGKAIPIRNFALDKSWMMAAHVKINCDSTDVKGDVFTQLSSLSDTEYSIRVTPDILLR